jgi:ribonuclease Z
LLKGTFRAIDKFEISGEEEVEFEDGIILNDSTCVVRAAVLEHRVPCLGFSLQENLHVNINKDRLKSMRVVEGAWLNDLKQSVIERKPDSYVIEIPINKKGDPIFEKNTLGQLKEDLVDISQGQKIGYVVDTIYNEPNSKRIIELVKSADIFFCESPFLADEEIRGQERFHLTSYQAGTLAREAGVKQLQVFHFSSRHRDRREQFYNEAQETFLGKTKANCFS